MAAKSILWTMMLFLSSCTLPEEKEIPQVVTLSDSIKLQDSGSYTAVQQESVPLPLKPVRLIKKPSGIYQAVLPMNGKMQQTVAFYPDFTFQLQEDYHLNKGDSMVFTKGNWSPSDGFIWLYHDQVVRGRYKWKDDTLQYYSPATKSSLSMNHMPDAADNETWHKKQLQGVQFFGVGTEPFWSVEYARDSISFQLSEWVQPLQLKLTHAINSADSVAYTAQNDSIQLRITVFPYFCNDGMSDFVYKNKVRVLLNNQVYNGCGIISK